MSEDPIKRSTDARIFLDGKALEVTSELHIEAAPWKPEFGWDVDDEGIDLFATRTGGFIMQTAPDDEFVAKMLAMHDAAQARRPEFELKIENRWPAHPAIPPQNVRGIRWRDMPRHLWAIMRRSFAEAAGTATNSRSTALVFRDLVLEPVTQRPWAMDHNGEMPARPGYDPIEFRTRRR